MHRLNAPFIRLALATLVVISPVANAIDISMKNDLLMFGGVSTVTIQGPDGYHFSSSESDELAFVTLDQIGILKDGVYHYNAQEIVLGATTILVTDQTVGRENTPRATVQSINTEAGNFTVKDGLIVDPEQTEPEG